MRTPATVLIAAVCGAVPVRAQKIPIRQVGPPEAVASTMIDRYSLVRPLSDGRVIVTMARSVGILSADLKTYRSIQDSTATPRATGAINQAALIVGRGDTTYIADPAGGGLITVDPSGTPGRMIAVPKSGDMSTIAFSNIGTFRTYMDPNGRLLYRSARAIPDAPGTEPPALSPPADSFPLVRADFESRAVDTLAAVRIPNPRRSINEGTGDQTKRRMIIFVAPINDAWTMLQDGTIAIVRGSDYHVDWIHPDGSRSSTPKMAFDWRRITDEEKARIVDSLQKGVDAVNAREDSIARVRTRLSGTTVQEVAPANTIPDYFPPVREGSARGDPDGNLWILPSTSASAQGGPLYDVVNRKGEVFERVQLPAGCTLAAIAKARIVYVTCGASGLERPGAGSLERRRILN